MPQAPQVPDVVQRHEVIHTLSDVAALALDTSTDVHGTIILCIPDKGYLLTEGSTKCEAHVHTITDKSNACTA